MVGTVPPSMTYSAPAIEEARSETRKPMRSAISCVLRESSERNSAEGVEDRLLSLVPGHLVALGEQVDEVLVGPCLDAAGADGVDPHAPGCQLVGEALAVGAQRRLGRRVGQRRVVQRHLTLDGRDVDDHSRAGLDHRRQEGAIQSDGTQEVEAQLGEPVLLARCCEPAGGSRRTADDVHQDAERTVLCEHARNDPYAGRRGGVGRDEAVGALVAVGHRSCGGPHVGAHLTQPLHHGLAGALGPARDERASTVEAVAI